MKLQGALKMSFKNRTQVLELLLWNPFLSVRPLVWCVTSRWLCFQLNWPLNSQVPQRVPPTAGDKWRRGRCCHGSLEGNRENVHVAAAGRHKPLFSSDAESNTPTHRRFTVPRICVCIKKHTIQSLLSKRPTGFQKGFPITKSLESHRTSSCWTGSKIKWNFWLEIPLGILYCRYFL